MILFLREDLGGAFIFDLPAHGGSGDKQNLDKSAKGSFYFADYLTLSQLDGFESLKDVKRKETKTFVEGVIKQAKVLQTPVEVADKVLEEYCNHPSIARRTDRLYELLASFQVFKDSGDFPSGGLICLYGGSGSGKTTFARELVEKHLDAKRDIVAIGSSEPDWSSAPIDVGLRALLLACTSITGRINVVFDSFRSIVYGSGGATLSGGVSASMLEILMNISRLAASSDKTVLGVINPLNTDEQKNETLVEALKGSTSGVIKFNADNFDALQVSIRTSSNRNFTVLARADVIDSLFAGKVWSSSENMVSNSSFKPSARVQAYTFNHAESRSELKDQLNVLSSVDKLDKLEFN